MIKRILKWTGITILSLALCITVVTAFRQNLKYDAPYPDLEASTDTTIIKKGRELVLGAAHCTDCHYKGNADSLLKLGLEVPLTGGVVFDLPVGKIYAKNITSDAETGIGKLTDKEIARAFRYGVHPDGTVVFDFMPFHNTSDEDLTAIISYLRTQKPVTNKIPANSLNVLGKLVKAFMVKPIGPVGEVAKRVKKDTTVEYGRYLAVNVANCNGCHTKRDLSGAFIGEPFGGGSPMDHEPGVAPLTPPNLTTDSTSQIFGWSQDDFVKRFRIGKVYPNSKMPWGSYGRMSEDEIKSIYKFLQTVKPVKNKVVQPMAIASNAH